MIWKFPTTLLVAVSPPQVFKNRINIIFLVTADDHRLDRTIR